MSCGARAHTSARAIPMALPLLRCFLGNHLAYCGSIGCCVLPVLLYRLLRAATALLRTAGGAYCSVACDSTTLRQPAPIACPTYCLGLEPRCRTSRRASAADAFTEVPLTYSTALLPTANCTCGYCHCVNCGTAHGGPWSLRAARCVRQSRRRPATTWLRDSTSAPSCKPATAYCDYGYCGRQFVSARPFRLSGLRQKP
jgi:hypothetical protein